MVSGRGRVSVEALRAVSSWAVEPRPHHTEGPGKPWKQMISRGGKEGKSTCESGGISSPVPWSSLTCSEAERGRGQESVSDGAAGDSPLQRHRSRFRRTEGQSRTLTNATSGCPLSTRNRENTHLKLWRNAQSKWWFHFKKIKINMYLRVLIFYPVMPVETQLFCGLSLWPVLTQEKPFRPQ